MGHFARINEDNIVVEVIVAEQEFIDTGIMGDPSIWLQCSYNTIAGRHVAGGTQIRKNFPGPGFTYDQELDAFIPPKPYPSWTLDKDTCLWYAPVPEPVNRTEYKWDEGRQQWIANVN
jgi:hypothetical protein